MAVSPREYSEVGQLSYLRSAGVAFLHHRVCPSAWLSNTTPKSLTRPDTFDGVSVPQRVSLFNPIVTEMKRNRTPPALESRLKT